MSDLEREYSPSSRVGGSSAPFVAEYQERSAQAASVLAPHVRTLPGGTVLVAPEPTAPLLVFVHGGYWQALSAADSLYLAPGALQHGWSFAAVEYTLAPAGTIEQMMGECRHALTLLAGQVGAREVVLAGHSAGAHLAAMVSLAALSPVRLSRVVLVSGVFDLRPLLHTTVNEPLALSPARARAASPLLLPAAGGSTLPVMVACGDNETAAFKDQSRRYAEHLRIGGMSVSSIESAPRHHFDIVDDLVDPLTELGRFTLGVR